MKNTSSEIIKNNLNLIFFFQDMTELLHKDISNKWESIKTNLKKGWPYSLVSIAIYFYVLRPLLQSIDFNFDIYTVFIKGAFYNILSFLIFGSVFLFLFLLLTLLLGSILRKMERKEINKIIRVITITTIGVFTMFIISSTILFLILTTGSIGF